MGRGMGGMYKFIYLVSPTSTHKNKVPPSSGEVEELWSRRPAFLHCDDDDDDDHNHPKGSIILAWDVSVPTSPSLLGLEPTVDRSEIISFILVE